MTTRVLKGATHNLYEARSDACHLAMGQLWSVLDHLGFKVGKKRIGESTLRVYPMKFGQYPLLNPLFEPNADHLGAVGLKDCLDMVVLSKGDDDLDRHLRAFASTDACKFVPAGVFRRGYYCHGDFVLPVHLSGIRGRQEIDFIRLGKGLIGMLRHLQ